ncbi:hypothetical protein CU098_000065, partial [Rhizopus stolonifer]
HAEDCVDDLCQGCDVGEVEISFIRKDAQGQTIDTEPSAQELLVMAIEESNQDIKLRLFDLALEKYQKEEPENRVGYATCLVELGKGIDVQESIREGLDVLRGEKTKTADIKLAISGAAIALALSIRHKQLNFFTEEQEKLDPEDTDALDELVEKQIPSKEQLDLYKESIDRFKEATKEEEQVDEAMLKEAHTVLNEIRTFGQLLSQPVPNDQTTKVLNTVIELIQQLPKHKENDEFLTLWAACLLNQTKEGQSEKESLDSMKKIEELLLKANALHAAKHEKENPWVWEMLAMNRINQSNLADDEDQAIDLYEEAIEAFKKAQALKPDDPQLANMLQMLMACEEEQEEEE